MRKAVLASQSAAIVLAMLVLGCVALWIAVPLGWLWVGSRVQAETGSIGLALLVMFAGLLASIAGVIWALVRLDHRHVELRAARGRDLRGPTALDRVLVASGVVALVGFVVWFVVFSGSSPFPGLELTTS